MTIEELIGWGVMVPLAVAMWVLLGLLIALLVKATWEVLRG